MPTPPQYRGREARQGRLQALQQLLGEQNAQGIDPAMVQELEPLLNQARIGASQQGNIDQVRFLEQLLKPGAGQPAFDPNSVEFYQKPPPSSEMGFLEALNAANPYDIVGDTLQRANESIKPKKKKKQ